ncbi:Nucleic acid-binding, OB-fold [Sesbania bispinosa]|nr:Nucleic acid-binding, OB-fold [Sesbania bispinosa]
MPRKVNLVEEIDRTKQSWKLAIRVTNVWRSENFVDMIFMDEKGGKIQASLKEADLRKLNVVLEEGYTYSIKNLEVKENTGEYKLCNNLYKVGFMKGTHVQQCDFPQIP